METILIKSFEEKESKAGRKYFVFDTNKGKMSCFEEKIAKSLSKEAVGKNVEVEIAESDDGKFKNIRKIGKILDNPNAMPEVVTEKMSDKFADARKEKNTAFYVSYAKDVFCQLIAQPNELKLTAQQIMKVSTDLVKQAIKEFE